MKQKNIATNKYNKLIVVYDLTHDEPFTTSAGPNAVINNQQGGAKDN